MSPSTTGAEGVVSSAFADRGLTQDIWKFMISNYPVSPPPTPLQIGKIDIVRFSHIDTVDMVITRIGFFRRKSMSVLIVVQFVSIFSRNCYNFNVSFDCFEFRLALDCLIRIGDFRFVLQGPSL